MKECPRCKSTNFRKDGIVNGKQRYLCRDCNYHFTVKQRGKPDYVKKNALHLYLEGLGFRSIGRYLGVSHVTVFNWIKAFGEKVSSLRSSTDIEVVEMDEMQTYIQSKKTIVGSGLLLIEMGKNSPTARWAAGEVKQEKSFGNA
jgi:transposase